MILLFGSQIQISAQQHRGPDHKRPGMEMHEAKKPGKPMNGKTIRQSDIKKTSGILLEEVQSQNYQKGGRKDFT